MTEPVETNDMRRRRIRLNYMMNGPTEVARNLLTADFDEWLAEHDAALAVPAGKADDTVNERAPWRPHQNHEIEAAAKTASDHATFTDPTAVRYGFMEGYDFASKAATGKAVQGEGDRPSRTQIENAIIFGDTPTDQVNGIMALLASPVQGEGE